MESGKKWNLVKPCRRRKIPEANHSRNQTLNLLLLSLQGKFSELLLTSPTNHETIHTDITHHGHSNQAQKEAFTSHAKAVGMGCLAFSRSLLHRKRQSENHSETLDAWDSLVLQYLQCITTAVILLNAKTQATTVLKHTGFFWEGEHYWKKTPTNVSVKSSVPHYPVWSLAIISTQVSCLHFSISKL